jgi:hypothetical protein
VLSRDWVIGRQCAVGALDLVDVTSHRGDGGDPLRLTLSAAPHPIDTLDRSRV